MDWISKLLETSLGKTVANLVIVFVLGCVVAYNLSSWVMTTDSFAEEKAQIYEQIRKGDLWQQLKIIELEKRSLTERLWTLEDSIDDSAPTLRQRNRLSETKLKF